MKLVSPRILIVVVASAMILVGIVVHAANHRSDPHENSDATNQSIDASADSTISSSYTNPVGGEGQSTSFIERFPSITNHSATADVERFPPVPAPVSKDPLTLQSESGQESFTSVNGSTDADVADHTASNIDQYGQLANPDQFRNENASQPIAIVRFPQVTPSDSNPSANTVEANAESIEALAQDRLNLGEPSLVVESNTNQVLPSDTQTGTLDVVFDSQGSLVHPTEQSTAVDNSGHTDSLVVTVEGQSDGVAAGNDEVPALPTTSISNESSDAEIERVAGTARSARRPFVSTRDNRSRSRVIQFGQQGGEQDVRSNTIEIVRGSVEPENDSNEVGEENSPMIVGPFADPGLAQSDSNVDAAADTTAATEGLVMPATPATNNRQQSRIFETSGGQFYANQNPGQTPNVGVSGTAQNATSNFAPTIAANDTANRAANQLPQSSGNANLDLNAAVDRSGAPSEAAADVGGPVSNADPFQLATFDEAQPSTLNSANIQSGVVQSVPEVDHAVQAAGPSSNEINRTPPVTIAQNRNPTPQGNELWSDYPQPQTGNAESWDPAQLQASPSDRRGFGADSESPLQNLISDAGYQDPITQSDNASDVGAAPGEMSYFSDGVDEPMADEMFEDPFSANPPFPIGCGRKYYAMADYVAYQPELGTTRISSAVGTDQSTFRDGGRVTFGYRDDCLKGWELTYLQLANVADIAGVQGPAGSFSTRFAPQGAISTTGFTGPNVTGHLQRQRLEFRSIEFNRVTWGWDVMNTTLGFRLFRMEDNVNLTSNVNGALRGLYDQNLQNTLFGPQIGLTLIDDSRFAFSYDFKARAGIYGNVVNGHTLYFNNVNNLPQVNNPNIRDVGFAAHAEVNMGLAWQLTQNLKLRAGADLLYIYGVATTRSQIDEFSAPNGAVPLTPAFGTSLHGEGDVLFWGGTVGIYGNWP